jgi:hypothetical protein
MSAANPTHSFEWLAALERTRKGSSSVGVGVSAIAEYTA